MAPCLLGQIVSSAAWPIKLRYGRMPLEIALRLCATARVIVLVLVANARSLQNQRSDATRRRCACEIPSRNSDTHWAHIIILVRGATSRRSRRRVAAITSYGYCFLGDHSPAPPGSMSNICQTAQKSSPGLNFASDTLTILLAWRWKTEIPGSHPPLLDL